MSQTFVTCQNTTLTVMTCWCGCVHAVTEELHSAWKYGSRDNLCCPLGHTYVPASRRENREKQLEARITSLNDRLDLARTQRDKAEKRASAYKGHITKIKKRIGTGVCPCCHRSFQNLARHMKHKHPKYGQRP